MGGAASLNLIVASLFFLLALAREATHVSLTRHSDVSHVHILFSVIHVKNELQLSLRLKLMTNHNKSDKLFLMKEERGEGIGGDTCYFYFC